MSETILKCIVCDSKKNLTDSWATKRLGLIEPYRVRHCPSCDMRWLSPRPTSEEYEKMYKGDDYFSGDQVPETYEIVVQERLRYYKKRCSKIKKMIGKSSFRLLDIGAATGEFINIATQAGISAEGIEVSEWACKMAKEKYDIDLTCSDLNGADFRDSSFDVVHLHHVFEHILSPSECLYKISRILKKNGLLVLEVPYQFENGLERIKKFLGKTNFQQYSLFSIHHPFFYSPNSLSTFLKIHGFDVLKKNTFDKDNPNSEIKSNIPFGGLVKKLILACANQRDLGDFIEIYAKRK